MSRNKIYKILKPIVITLALFYIASFTYTLQYWEEIRSEFNNTSETEVAAILLYRGMINIVASIFAVPLAILYQLLHGLWNCGIIILSELSEIPYILWRIFQSKFVRWIWDGITYIMTTIGQFLEPYFTRLVRMTIYFVLFVIPVYIASRFVMYIKKQKIGSMIRSRMVRS